MVRIILVTHGNLASALLEGAEIILGEKQPSVLTVCLSAADSLDSAHAELEAALDSLQQPVASEESLVLVDLFGGTASNAAAWALKGKDFQIVAGVNLPMLLEVLLNHDRMSASALAKLALTKGIQSIVDVRAVVDGTSDC